MQVWQLWSCLVCYLRWSEGYSWLGSTTSSGSGQQREVREALARWEMWRESNGVKKAAITRSPAGGPVPQTLGFTAEHQPSMAELLLSFLVSSSGCPHCGLLSHCCGKVSLTSQVFCISSLWSSTGCDTYPLGTAMDLKKDGGPWGPHGHCSSSQRGSQQLSESGRISHGCQFLLPLVVMRPLPPCE